jgi:hypothetical protein
MNSGTLLAKPVAARLALCHKSTQLSAARNSWRYWDN